MDLWKKVWRKGVVPLLSREELIILKKALENDDPRLIQGATSNPPPLQCVMDWDCEGACLLGFIRWQSRRLITVGDVEEEFADFCFHIDQNIGEPAGCRWLLNHYDETPRNEMIRDFLEEIDVALTNYNFELREWNAIESR